MHASKIISFLGLLASAATAVSVTRSPNAPVGNGNRQLTFNDAVIDNTLSPRSASSFSWLAATGNSTADGEYLTKNKAGDYIRASVLNNKTTVAVKASQIPAGTSLYAVDKQLRTIVVVGKPHRPEYLDPLLYNYWVIDVATGKSTPLMEGQNNDIAAIQLSPSGRAIAFIYKYNVYVWKCGKVKQITFDGSRDLYHGVCNWACATDLISGLIFSPDEAQLAVISANNKDVYDYPVDFFTQGEDLTTDKIAPQYPHNILRIYPNAGAKVVPKPEIRLVQLKNGTAITRVPSDEFDGSNILGGFLWASDAHSTFIYEILNRVQDKAKIVAVDAASASKKVIRERAADDNGWLRSDSFDINAFVGEVTGKTAKYFIEVAEDDGWAHLYLQAIDGSDRIQLTKGEWEVRNLLTFDAERQVAYFTATKQHSTESHLYSVAFDASGKVTALVNEEPGYWSASFTPSAKYYVAAYQGPNVPYQQLYKVGNDEALAVIQDNAALVKLIDTFSLPNITFYEMKHPDGFTMNVKRIVPPNFDPSKKYPVLFQPYGGPGSQRATKSFTSYSWVPYVSADPELGFIVYIIDNRGTGFKGRKFRSPIVGQLGKIEVEDQIWAAKELLATTPYLDANHVAFWGWSFGGYMASKIAESDTGVFTCALITAPVSDWRFYNSGYTERYMKTPDVNPAGYDARAVRKTAGFKNMKGGVAFMFGTADANVHPQHSRVVIDNLVGDGMLPSKLKTFEFTDSDHGIKYHGATRFLYRFLTERLWDELQRSDKVHQWSQAEPVIAANASAPARGSTPDDYAADSGIKGLYMEGVVF